MLHKKSPLSNQYFVFGLFCDHPNIRKEIISEFNAISPNKRAHQLTYRSICALGVYSSLSLTHQEEGLDACIAEKIPISSQLMTSLVTSKIPKIKLYKRWFGLAPELTVGYRSLCKLEHKFFTKTIHNWENRDLLNQSPKDKLEALTKLYLQGKQEDIHLLILHSAIARRKLRENAIVLLDNLNAVMNNK